jgi:hypothetical protein
MGTGDGSVTIISEVGQRSWADVIGHARIRALTAGAESSLAGLQRVTERGRAVRQRNDPSLKQPEQTGLLKVWFPIPVCRCQAA